MFYCSLEYSWNICDSVLQNRNQRQVFKSAESVLDSLVSITILQLRVLEYLFSYIEISIIDTIVLPG